MVFNVNEALKEVREIVAEAKEAGDDPKVLLTRGEKLVTLVDGIDKWLSRGGALPDSWSSM